MKIKKKYLSNKEKWVYSHGIMTGIQIGMVVTSLVIATVAYFKGLFN